MQRDRVLVFDTSLRDGEQAPGCSMNGDEKLLFAKKLQVLGVDIIEAGFPVASAGDAEAVRRIATEVQGPVIAALARCVEKDIAVAWEAVSRSMRPRIHTFLATSDIHLAFKLKIGRDEALNQAPQDGRLCPLALYRRRILARGRNPVGRRLPVRSIAGGSRFRRDHAEHSRHRRLHHA